MASKCFYGIKDALVVGSHIDVVDDAGHLLINSLNDALASEHGKRLAREARGSIAGGNDGNEFHVVSIYLDALKPSSRMYLRFIMR